MMPSRTIFALIQVRARPDGIWTLALQYVPPKMLLCFRANGTWNYSMTGRCGPDGDLTSLLSRTQLQVATAPVGALIGKIGGSTAGWNDGTQFLIGTTCVYRVPDGVDGALYLTINDEYTGMRNNGGDVAVEISEVIP
jgi:hypothetical protein